jgi:hypothetical protein
MRVACKHSFFDRYDKFIAQVKGHIFLCSPERRYAPCCVNIAFSPFYGTASYPTLHAAIHAILNIVGSRASLPDYMNTVSEKEIHRLHSLGLL